MGKVKNQKVDMPEIQEFLKLSRNFIRQLEIIKNNEIDAKYICVVDSTIENVHDEIKRYIQEIEM